MAKTTGMGDNFYVAGVDVSGSVNSITELSGGPSPLDLTDITQSAMYRLGGQLEGKADWISYFDPAAGASHGLFSALPTADVIMSYFQGTVLGNPAAGLVAKQVNYDGTRSPKGDYTFKLNGLSNAYSVEWGVQGTAGKRTDSAATNGTGIDLAATTSFGLQAYLHVFTGFAGTNVTVKLQESNDNASTDPYADTTGGAFTAATGITSQRIATAPNQSVKRWIRVVTTGLFSNAVFAVVIVKNPVAVTF